MAKEETELAAQRIVEEAQRQESGAEEIQEAQVMTEEETMKEIVKKIQQDKEDAMETKIREEVEKEKEAATQKLEAERSRRDA